MLPGKHRLNPHAIYGEFISPTDRNEIGPEHFSGWIDWARQQEGRLDFILLSSHIRMPPMDSRFLIRTRGSGTFELSMALLRERSLNSLGENLKIHVVPTFGFQTALKVLRRAARATCHCHSSHRIATCASGRAGIAKGSFRVCV